MLIGAISDTHGRLRPQALAALQGCDLVLHAGDIGRPEVLDGLRRVAPRVVAVRGNVDGDWAAGIPERVELTLDRWRVLLLHDRKTLAKEDATGFDVIVSGHSHLPRIERSDGVLYVNPGSAGPRRFRLPVALARLTLAPTGATAELVELEV